MNPGMQCMRGRRWKQLANLWKNPECPQFIGEPESSYNSDSSTMPPRVAKPVYTLGETLVLGLGESLGREDGTWEDVDYYFVECRNDPQPLDFYYRDLSGAYGGPDGTSGREPYNQQTMDSKFLNAPGTRYPCAPMQRGLGFTPVEINDALKATFHFENGFEWRWPEPHERIYHHPGGGYAGIPLEHLRGMRPSLHQFVKDLCRDEYGIPFTQLAPNSIKWISWFLGCCHIKGYIPTFRLFHHLFKIKKSASFPLF